MPVSPLRFHCRALYVVDVVIGPSFPGVYSISVATPIPTPPAQPSPCLTRWPPDSIESSRGALGKVDTVVLTYSALGTLPKCDARTAKPPSRMGSEHHRRPRAVSASRLLRKDRPRGGRAPPDQEETLDDLRRTSGSYGRRAPQRSSELAERPGSHRRGRAPGQASVRGGTHPGDQVVGATGAAALGQGRRVARLPKRQAGGSLTAVASGGRRAPLHAQEVLR